MSMNPLHIYWTLLKSLVHSANNHQSVVGFSVWMLFCVPTLVDSSHDVKSKRPIPIGKPSLWGMRVKTESPNDAS